MLKLNSVSQICRCLPRESGFTGTCGDGLLYSGQYNYAEKPILYPGFKSIVSGH